MSLLGKVLLVDDDPDIRLALSDYLQQEGFEVDIAHTAHEAIQKNTVNRCDVVLLDVGLPDRDGVEVLDELSHKYPQLPIILLTGFTSLRTTADPTILDRAFAYLTKPYNRQEVKTSIQRALVGRSAVIRQESQSLSAKEVIPPILQGTPLTAAKERGEPNIPNLQMYEQFAQHIQLMQFAFDHVSEAVLVAGPDKHFRFVNQAACDSLGYTREELLALRIPDIDPNHATSRFRQHLETLKNGQPLTYLSTHRTKEGREIPIKISVYLLQFEGQEFTCAVIRDLSLQPEYPKEENTSINLDPSIS